MSYYVQELISTPQEKIIPEIEKFLALKIPKETISKLLSDPEIAKKLLVLIERLEFVEMLAVFQNAIEKKTTTQETINSGISTQQFTAVLFDHDVSGGDKDIEGLRIYLLLTCIDTIMGPTDYKSVFAWLKEKTDTTTVPNSELDILENEYREKYGLNKLFVDAFWLHLDDTIKNEWNDNFIICSVKSHEIEEANLQKWNVKTSEEKIKKIANYLYNIRSKFTHSSVRSFNLTLDIENSPMSLGKMLIRKGDGIDFIELITRTVQSIAKKKLLST